MEKQSQNSKNDLGNKIDNSLFLDPGKKAALEAILPTISLKERLKLEKILESEDEDLAKIIANYMIRHGAEGVQNLDQIISAAKKKLAKEKEILSQQEDEELMVELEHKLEDADE